MESQFVLYTAALPAYRRACLEQLERRFGSAWRAFAGASLLDRSVKTSVPGALYTPVANYRCLGGRVLFQWGHWREVVSAQTAILDLNPRSLSAWVLLLIRKTLRRRTLVWGHLDPRKGRSARTAPVRAAMREIADGCIVYSYENASHLTTKSGNPRVWVAPNALYPREILGARQGTQRNVILYVGRLEPPKKPRLLLDAFALVTNARPDWRVVFVGEGSLRNELTRDAERLGLKSRVAFCGEIYDSALLAGQYAAAYCSVCPGFAGLALTQSFGFGVPMVVADAEPHAPEIEMADHGPVVFFSSNSAESLAAALESPKLQLDQSARDELVDWVKRRYSIEAMVRGIAKAVANEYPGDPLARS
jgi:glycosyltransferase involved in cell wall biosynthesis